MENHSIFFTATEIAEKIAEIGSGRRGKSKILVHKTGVLNDNMHRATERKGKIDLEQCFIQSCNPGWGLGRGG
jgi:hypothetical protein